MTIMKLTTEQKAAMQPQEFRELARRAEWTEINVGFCQNYAMNNLAIVPKKYAFEFFLFCQRNPRPCPVVDVTEPGSPHPKLVAPTADLRTDLPRYRVFMHGELVDEPTDVVKYWRDDLVCFLIGCSGTIDWALQAANVVYTSFGAYTTSIPCVPAGPFSGPMVVSCRAFKDSFHATRAVQISSRYLSSHGPPVHIGDGAVLGIKDITKPDAPGWHEPRPVGAKEVLLWWGCGMTPQTTAQAAKLPIFITHKGGYMFINDLRVEEAANL